MKIDASLTAIFLSTCGEVCSGNVPADTSSVASYIIVIWNAEEEQGRRKGGGGVGGEEKGGKGGGGGGGRRDILDDWTIKSVGERLVLGERVVKRATLIKKN